jgi:hypothetical protein
MRGLHTRPSIYLVTNAYSERQTGGGGGTFRRAKSYHELNLPGCIYISTWETVTIYATNIKNLKKEFVCPKPNAMKASSNPNTSNFLVLVYMFISLPFTNYNYLCQTSIRENTNIAA